MRPRAPELGPDAHVPFPCPSEKQSPRPGLPSRGLTSAQERSGGGFKVRSNKERTDRHYIMQTGFWCRASPAKLDWVLTMGPIPELSVS
jgi:hypothetical protein